MEGELAEFVHRLRGRLHAGAREYGNTSFTRPIAELLDEVQQELLDTAGWGFLAWTRLERLRTRLELVDRREREAGGL